MSRTPAKITQADVARALRAVLQCGGGTVEVKRDGTLICRVGGAVESKDTDESQLDKLPPLVI